MFTDFMPNYENMMEKSMGGSKGGGFSNFSSMNVMLEGFMELQKQQMELEKINLGDNLDPDSVYITFERVGETAF